MVEGYVEITMDIVASACNAKKVGVPNPAEVHTVYRKKDGIRVPSVTTYLGVLGKPALIHWAWELGVQGLDYRKVRDQAGGTGTLVHYLILCQLKGQEPDLSYYAPQDLASAASPMNKFNEWLKGKTLEPILLETPLVSELYGFGGTPDYYGKVDGIFALLDFKTGKEVYQEAFYQVAAYANLLIEHNHPIQMVKIIRIGKSEDEGFEERATGNLENHWKVFLACQQIYELQKLIRKGRKKETD